MVWASHIGQEMLPYPPFQEGTLELLLAGLESPWFYAPVFSGGRQEGDPCGVANCSFFKL